MARAIPGKSLAALKFLAAFGAVTLTAAGAATIALASTGAYAMALNNSVRISPAMNHGGPYPATGHAGFTAVGIPAAMRRFGALACYDGVRQHRLPAILGNQNPGGRAWRTIDGVWTQGDVKG